MTEMAFSEPIRPLLENPAVFSDDGVYRYFLRRNHSMLVTRRVLLWIMLNPSKAGTVNGDPTTTLTCNLGKGWGFGIHAAVNCFALVGTDPACLSSHDDPVGPRNDDFIRRAIEWCDGSGGQIIVAWGAGAALHCRGDAVLRLLARRTVWCLGRNADGSPRFPRAVPKSVEPQEWVLT